jgi:GT2 family glycosyltransferase
MTQAFGGGEPRVAADALTTQPTAARADGDLRGAAEPPTVLKDPAIVIVTYNSAGAIDSCLKTLHGFEVLVVDNASADDTVTIVRKHSWVNVITSAANRGFAAGVNIGLRHFACRDVLLLNPDVRTERSAIDSLVRTLNERPRAGVVAPMLLYPDGGPQESARSFKSWSAVLARRTSWGQTKWGRRALDRHLISATEPTEVDWVIGAAMLVRAAAVQEVGEMDERFFLYEEDLDWCARMWAGGWQVVYDPRVRMFHDYARASSVWWDLRRRATRAHWRSLFRLAMRYPAQFFLSRPLRPPPRSPSGAAR